jgi:hypothetical protein
MGRKHWQNRDTVARRILGRASPCWGFTLISAIDQGGDRLVVLANNRRSFMSNTSQNAFAAGREVSGGFFKEIEKASPQIVDSLVALRHEYLRAWADGIIGWIDFSESILETLNVRPKVSSELKGMAQDATETWIKAEQDLITGTLDASRHFVRASAAGTQVLNAVGFRATKAAVDAIRARTRSVNATTAKSAAKVAKVVRRAKPKAKRSPAKVKRAARRKSA